MVGTRLYKYVKVKIAKLILINQITRFSSPLLFNDPFDITSNIKYNFTFEEKMGI